VKVKELIEALQNFEQEMEIYGHNCDHKLDVPFCDLSTESYPGQESGVYLLIHFHHSGEIEK
jgi:hypothetical protein